jgi:hypothetical protein
MRGILQHGFQLILVSKSKERKEKLHSTKFTSWAILLIKEVLAPTVLRNPHEN